MGRTFAAVVWKEVQVLRRRLKTVVLVTAGLGGVMVVVLASRLGAFEALGASSSSAQSFFYVATYIGLISTIFTLRFWEERSSRTIEYLFTVPMPIQLLAMAKVLPSVLFALVMSAIALAGFTVLGTLWTGMPWPGAGILILSLASSLCFSIAVGVIHGACMWRFSKTVAIAINIVTLGIVFGGMSVAWVGVSESQIAVFPFRALAIAVIVSWILALLLLMTLDKEKSIINLAE